MERPAGCRAERTRRSGRYGPDASGDQDGAVRAPAALMGHPCRVAGARCPALVRSFGSRSTCRPAWLAIRSNSVSPKSYDWLPQTQAQSCGSGASRPPPGDFPRLCDRFGVPIGPHPSRARLDRRWITPLRPTARAVSPRTRRDCAGGVSPRTSRVRLRTGPSTSSRRSVTTSTRRRRSTRAPASHPRGSRGAASAIACPPGPAVSAAPMPSRRSRGCIRSRRTPRSANAP